MLRYPDPRSQCTTRTVAASDPRRHTTRPAAANNASTNERGALYHYNHSSLYVDAVARYANRMTHDPRAFYRYYSWSVYIHTRGGYRRVTGPR